MRKPEFSRPFNILDAKAGAPYCCRDGEEAIVLKWDGRRFNEPLVGCIGADDVPASWGGDGRYVPDEHCPRPRDLVMLPFGMCQSKPIFMGDELVTRFGDKFVVEAKHIGGLCEENTWPAPTPAYPVTLMTDGDLVSNYYGGGPVSHEQEYQAWRRIANAAIRHGIDNGYLLDPKTAAKNIHNAVSTFASEVECRHAIVYIERERKMIRAGIEQGWREAYLTFSEPPPPHVERHVPSAMPRSDTDVDELIASVTAAKDAKEGAK